MSASASRQGESRTCNPPDDPHWYRRVQPFTTSVTAQSPSCGARRMAQTAAHLVDHVIPHVPVRQWVLIWVMSLPIPLRLLLAAQPKLVTPVLQVVHRVITRHLLGQAGLKADEVDSGAVTLIQRFGSAANLRSGSVRLNSFSRKISGSAAG